MLISISSSTQQFYQKIYIIILNNKKNFTTQISITLSAQQLYQKNYDIILNTMRKKFSTQIVQYFFQQYFKKKIQQYFITNNVITNAIILPHNINELKYFQKQFIQLLHIQNYLTLNTKFQKIMYQAIQYNKLPITYIIRNNKKTDLKYKKRALLNVLSYKSQQQQFNFHIKNIRIYQMLKYIYI
eukprot:TRINITY_DN161_c2_g1_i7.p1 TRINITY_DN161_c2_g1~~TRINITY_DN161_c2_g1_i7.p1  ORF type:complete len:185 (-),score=-26.07 TRINITY_DN161_c2_g1_i7:422-976(-)